MDKMTENAIHDGDEMLERAVFNMLKAYGWIVPSDKGSVRRAECQLAKQDFVLPQQLLDAQAFLRMAKKSSAPQGNVFNPETTRAVADNLARAARDGNNIPAEVEDRMRRHRIEAEERKDSGQKPC